MQKYELNKLCKKWAEAKGETAVVLLMSVGVSSRAAELLCKGKYKHEVKALKSKILDVLAKDGFILKAS